MMTLSRIKAFIFIVIIIFISGPPSHAADYDYIDITNPFLHKSPIAIPPFNNPIRDSNIDVFSKDASNLLSETLAFTGYFKIIDMDSEASQVIVSNVDYGRWKTMGAELLITGSVLIDNDIAELELRLYDTINEKLIIGKRYKGWVKDFRRIIRRFCSEVIYHIAGTRGFFNSKIAFVSNGSGNKEIFICEFDGHNPVQQTHANSITLSPAWSSDGKWLAYTSFTKGKPDLYIQHLTEKRGAVLAKEGVNIAPGWVPGKFMLGATLSYSGDQEIYLLTGTGKMIKRLTYNRGIDVSPSFSPDGEKMAFVTKRAGTPQIYIMDLTSGISMRLTFQGHYNTQPSWSPAGDKIAYAGLIDGRSDIYVIDVDGKNLLQLTRDQGDNESPSWSPDGSLIVFSSTREGPSRIYVMTAFGTDQRRLLVLPGEQSVPQWSPNLINNPASSFN